ncbi:hypothetical protein O1C66_000394 [Vibrio cholerae]|nr:hypothetical protein [Vibrio cholerae]EKF9660227.1 hypothetical protein [Vibrio cholerae]EKF9843350.1 hypothetical protein [Vibrio cholerae]
MNESQILRWEALIQDDKDSDTPLDNKNLHMNTELNKALRDSEMICSSIKRVENRWNSKTWFSEIFIAHTSDREGLQSIYDRSLKDVTWKYIKVYVNGDNWLQKITKVLSILNGEDDEYKFTDFSSLFSTIDLVTDSDKKLYLVINYPYDK